MSERDPVPALLVRIDRLIQTNATLANELAERLTRDAVVDARLENIERAIPVPATYTAKQAAKRLNKCLDWCYRQLPKQIAPVSRDPLRFSVAEIDKLVASRARQKVAS